MKDLDIKANVLKDMLSFFKGEDKKSWDEVLKGESEDMGEKEDEEEEEECECGKPSCKICGKPKGVMIEETIIAVPKKK